MTDNTAKESIFTTMSKAALKHEAINLSQGFPDMPVDPWIVEQGVKAAALGPFQYAPVTGLLPLREAFQSLYREKFDLNDPVETITVTNGATQGLYLILRTLLGRGDEAVLMAPFYDSYVAAVEMNGARARQYTLKAPDFAIDEQRLRELIVPGTTKMIVLNNPHNPSGRVFSREELEVVAKLAREFDLWVLADEVYEFLVYRPHRHTPFRSLPGMAQRTLTTVSMGKTYGVTGFKIGAVIAAYELTIKLLTHLQFMTFSVNSPLQTASAHVIQESLKNGHFERAEKIYEEKRDLCFAGLKAVGLTPYLTEGSYFMLADFSQFSSKGDFDFAMELTEKAKVASVPPSAFYLKGESEDTMLRFCFAKKNETLENALKKLKEFLQ